MRPIDVVSKLVAVVLVATAALGSCFSEPQLSAGKSGAGGTRETGGAPNGDGGVAGVMEAPVCVARTPVDGAQCHAVTSGEPMRARVVEDVPQETLYFTETLFGEFNSLCGSCHVASDLGSFGVSRATFAAKVDEASRAAVRSDQPTCERDASGNKLDETCFAFMPPAGSPNGKPWSERKDDPNDPVTRLEGLLALWIDAGRPVDAFTVPAGLSGESPYAIDAEFAETFSNLGTCIPDAGMVATELDVSCALDARFAALEKKPDSSLPHEQLGLPATLQETDLFTLDSAELARHGVVAYSPTYPLWSDGAGKLRHLRLPQGQSIRFNPKTREFEVPSNTRFYKTFLKEITDRDGVQRFRKIETRIIVSRPGQEPLFGAYQWNEEETQASLVTDPLNNGRPFKDRLLTIVTDLPKADAIKAEWEAGKIRNYSRELDSAGVVRRYAIPGSERCIQCHMGGLDSSFVLGFTPLQLYARPCDRATLDAQGHCDGGVIEPAIGDQLTQLERFIEYGIITGYDIATQLVSLEDPQGTADAPRPHRTPEELVAQGYLYGNCMHCHNPDGYPSVLSPELKPLLDFRPSEVGGIFGFPLERYSPRVLRAQGKIQLPYITPSLRDIFTTDEGWKPKVAKSESGLAFIDAPWRSLIYRNVDTPFTYFDHGTIYPHMPLNTPGFDCRAPRIVGEWMVSIPALRKQPDLTEDVTIETSPNVRDDDPQPYREVKPEDPAYLNALAQAQKRLAAYRSGSRHSNYCAETKDIIDVWDVLYGVYAVPQDGSVSGMPVDNVPDRPHWVVTDVTDPPGEWTPRRTDWKTILIDQDFTASERALEENYFGARKIFEAERIAREKQTVAMLEGLSLSEALRKYATTPQPFGVWMPNPSCDFSSVPKAGDYPHSQRPRWMQLGALPEETPIYEVQPGASVYNMICVNCHGVDGDSQGRQAVTLQEMTGGVARVANFRDGLFGPLGSGGANRKRVFGSDELAMSYVAWMALGGTRTEIVPGILALVAGTPVLGGARPEPPPVTTANMLDTARALCRGLVVRGINSGLNPAALATLTGASGLNKGSGLIGGNGDADLWAALCTFDNPAPVHALRVTGNAGAEQLFNQRESVFAPGAYPANTPVGDALGRVQPALLPSNDFAWCVIEPTDPAQQAFVSQQQSSDGKPLPLCPSGFVGDQNRWSLDGTESELERFGTRGAVNAGFAVYLYLEQLLGQGKPRALSYDECEQLSDSEAP